MYLMLIFFTTCGFHSQVSLLRYGKAPKKIGLSFYVYRLSQYSLLIPLLCWYGILFSFLFVTGFGAIDDVKKQEFCWSQIFPPDEVDKIRVSNKPLDWHWYLVKSSRNSFPFKKKTDWEIADCGYNAFLNHVFRYLDGNAAVSVV